ncbi:hypothetical protein LTR78_009346 [Recurvomyces mirabilis]|uniref:J domain-containing protein n=1 Tax=Recurvomyces mirabilis TaxID=574656 RepID=A0AAE0TPQ2_9PEZI|nr:hypothetical protein LTR78_009346 [Recurvomyces mirabilis]
MSQSSRLPDGELYRILGVEPDADQDAIKKAYRKRSFEEHPDKKAPEEAAEASKIFIRVTSAYVILNDPGKRKQYDRSGELGEPLSFDESRQRFDTVYADEDALDKEADKLVDFWTLSSTLSGSPAHSLETSFDGFERNLEKLFADYSLMSSSKRKLRAESLENLAMYCGRNFGKQNEERLRAWNGRDQLTPFIDGKYYARDDNLVDKAEVPVELFYGIDRVRQLHHAYDKEFRLMVEDQNVNELVKLLNQSHKPEYENAVARYRPMLRANVATKIDWKDVRNILQALRKVKQADRLLDNTWKPQRAQFDLFAQTAIFPSQWTQVIDEVLAPGLKTAPAIQSTFGHAATVEDEDMGGVAYPDLGNEAGPSRSKGKAAIRPQSTTDHDRLAAGSTSQDLGVLGDADDSIFVQDWQQNSYKVFGWRTFGRVDQLFLEVQRPNQATELKILRIESALPYRRTLESVKQRPGLDLNRKRLTTTELRDHDLSEFRIIGFAQVVPGIAPTTGYSRDTPCYFITQLGGETRVVTRSEMSSAYGQPMIGRILQGIQQKYSKELVRMKPMQKQLALQYAMGESDSDSDPDYSSDSPPSRHHGRGAMRQLGSSYRARTAQQPQLLLGQARRDPRIEESKDRVGDALHSLEDLDPSERDIVLQSLKTMNDPQEEIVGGLEQLKISYERKGGKQHSQAIDELLSLAKGDQTAVTQHSRAG